MTGPAFDRVLDALRAAGRQTRQDKPNHAMAQCPAHEDGRPSLSVTSTESQVLLYCFAGCATADVVAALGLNLRDLYHEPLTGPYGLGEAIRYKYPDGRENWRSTTRKDFRRDDRRAANHEGPKALYDSDRLDGAPLVYVAEGEKDADALRAAGGVAVACPGAKAAAGYDWTPLHGRDVVVVAHRDEAGGRYAADVVAALAGRARVRVVRSAVGEDAADHVAAGRTLAELEDYPGPQVGSDFHPAPEPLDAPGALVEPEPEELPPTWAPVDLGPILDGTREDVRPTLLPRSDGVCLVYPGLTHSFHGESESGKSLVLQLEAVRLLALGERVLFVDFESDAASVVGRLVEFGADPDTVRRRFVYVRPEVRPDASARELRAWLDVLGGRFALAIVDGVTDALGVFGYSTKDNDDVSAWARELPRRIADRTGAAVVVVDHVTKDADSRGRFAIGGQAKLSGLTGAAYTVEVRQPLGRGLRGVIVLRVGKDRPGYVRGHAGPMRASDRTQEVARVVVDSTKAAPVVAVEPWQGHASDPDAPARPWRPTAIMESLSRALEGTDKPLSFRALDGAVQGKAEHKRTALAELDGGGFITITASGSANLHASVKPYRQAADPLSDAYRPGDTLDPADTGSDPSGGCVPCPHPYTGDGDTHTQPPSTVSGTHRGHTRDTVAHETETCPLHGDKPHPDACYTCAKLAGRGWDE